jgi:hypothetical protein
MQVSLPYILTKMIRCNYHHYQSDNVESFSAFSESPIAFHMIMYSL